LVKGLALDLRLSIQNEAQDLCFKFEGKKLLGLIHELDDVAPTAPGSHFVTSKSALQKVPDTGLS